MSWTVKAEVVGVSKALATLRGLEGKIKAAWTKELTTIGDKLVRGIRTSRLNKPKKAMPGEQKLSRQSGDLSRDVNRKLSTGNDLAVSVGTRLGYGAIWVRGFTRTWRGKKKSTTRTLPPRDYLRSELRAQETDIRKRLTDVPRKVIERARLAKGSKVK